MEDDRRQALIRFLAKVTAEILQNWIVEGKRPRIVWEKRNEARARTKARVEQVS